jgi:hypothetical protein
MPLFKGAVATPVTGGCLCKAVRYTIDAQPILTRECWCRVCQDLGAGSSAVNSCLHAAALRVTGELRDYHSTADSGNTMHRSSRPGCGTPVFSAHAIPASFGIRTGGDAGCPGSGASGHDDVDRERAAVGPHRPGLCAGSRAAAAGGVERYFSPSASRSCAAVSRRE